VNITSRGPLWPGELILWRIHDGFAMIGISLTGFIKGHWLDHGSIIVDAGEKDDLYLMMLNDGDVLWAISAPEDEVIGVE